ARVEIEPFGMFLVNTFRPAPNLRRQGFRQVLGQAKRLAHIPECALGAVADDGRTKRSTLAAIGLVDPLDNLFAPLMLEIHIDIRWFPAFLAYETFEQQVIAIRVD